MRLAHLGDDLAHADRLGVRAQDRVDLVHAGEGDEGVGALDARVLEDGGLRAIVADDLELREHVLDLLADAAVALDEGDLDARGNELAREVEADAAAAHDDDVADGLLEDGELLEQAADPARGAHDEDVVVRTEGELRRGDKRLAVAHDRCDQRALAEGTVVIGDGRPAEGVIGLELELDELGTVAREGIDLRRRREAQHAADLVGACQLGVDDEREAQLLLEEEHLAEVVLLADARHGVLGAELARHERIDAYRSADRYRYQQKLQRIYERHRGESLLAVVADEYAVDHIVHGEDSH